MANTGVQNTKSNLAPKTISIDRWKLSLLKKKLIAAQRFGDSFFVHIFQECILVLYIREEKSAECWRLRKVTSQLFDFFFRRSSHYETRRKSFRGYFTALCLRLFQPLELLRRTTATQHMRNLNYTFFSSFTVSYTIGPHHRNTIFSSFTSFRWSLFSTHENCSRP